MAQIFITGIDTEVGKTVISAIVTEALNADYFKPIQAGDLEFSDTDKVRSLVTNENSKFHANSYALKTPMSPHAAADIDKIKIDIEKIVFPNVKNHLVVEGAGGLLVPLNDMNTIYDLISPHQKIILVSRHYLGSINHTLMSCELLRQKGCDVGIIFNGNSHETTENIISKMSNFRILGRIDKHDEITPHIVSEYALQLSPSLKAWINE